MLKFRHLLLGCTLAVAAVGAPALAQNDSITVTCPDGMVIENGMDVIVNFRPGDYTITAVGIDGFDPRLAVTEVDGGEVLGCNDDSRGAANYEVNLPTTGNIDSSGLSAQVVLTSTEALLFNYYVTVGGLGGENGEFVLIIEDMAVTSADGSGEAAGDPFKVVLTQNMAGSSAAATAYMIANTTAIDPYVTVVDEDNNVLAECDDAGGSNCYGETESLTGASITLGNNTIPGGSLDSMMTIPWDAVTIAEGEDISSFIEFRFTSLGQNTLGDYTAVFHIGIEPGSSSGGSGSSGGGGKGGSGGTGSTDPDAFAIEYGEAVEGSLDAGEVVLYAFEGEEGDEITASMLSDDFDTYLTLINMDGDVLAEDDDSAGNLDAELSYELEEDGMYVLIASAFGGEDGTGEGDFVIGVSIPTGGTSGGGSK